MKAREEVRQIELQDRLLLRIFLRQEREMRVHGDLVLLERRRGPPARPSSPEEVGDPRAQPERLGLLAVALDLHAHDAARLGLAQVREVRGGVDEDAQLLLDLVDGHAGDRAGVEATRAVPVPIPPRESVRRVHAAPGAAAVRVRAQRRVRRIRARDRQEPRRPREVRRGLPEGLV
ncbi:MAG: hypothetical protein CMH85_07635 [Novosphingobium sp.]|nr:hypothetical protein [Novosphingobium sp.]